MNEKAKIYDRLDHPESPHFAPQAEITEYQAWEEVEAGRYMPRRVRGSYRGRALG